jgi:hypothetical protein
MALKFIGMQFVGPEQGGIAKAALHAIDSKLDNMTKIVVVFSLHIGILCRNGRRTTPY